MPRVLASGFSLSAQLSPPPKSTVSGQLIACGKGRLGRMSSVCAISTGRQPAAIASKRRRDVGVSPAGTWLGLAFGFGFGSGSGSG